VLLREALHRELEPELATPHARPQGCAAQRREAYFAAVASRHAAGLRRPSSGHAPGHASGHAQVNTRA